MQVTTFCHLLSSCVVLIEASTKAVVGGFHWLIHSDPKDVYVAGTGRSKAKAANLLFVSQGFEVFFDAFYERVFHSLVKYSRASLQSPFHIIMFGI